MSFFKKLFGRKPEENQPAPNFTGIYNEKHFNERYEEQNINEEPALLDGCLKMVESYFMDNKMERKVASPINHPANLDQVVDDGMGFQMYCKAFQLDDGQIIMFLAFAFSEFLIKNNGFKLYKDNQPETPIRTMTLQYDKNGSVLSLYPFEYSLKVLNYEATFTDLYSKVTAYADKLPAADELLKDYLGPKSGDQ